MRLSNIGLLVTTLISNIGISNADTDNELEKRNSCSTQVSSCSLTPYNHGYPAASVSWGNTVTDLGNGIYEGTMNFQGKDCSQFDNTNEIKIDGGAATVVVYSYNNLPMEDASGQQCMKDGMQIQYDFADGKNSFDYSFGCGSGGQFDLPEMCWSANCGNPPTNTPTTTTSPNKPTTTTTPNQPTTTASNCVPQYGNNITYDHLFIEYINDPNHENIGDTNDYGQLLCSTIW
ncbi:hypothetical protein PICMEDRAFT_70982 [Pichia membranifaciens NRRL Y-2026]|uniref:Flo11 domain-containing protein n=1 Tax=Pichia membranifaciens NRRL Y-2026 TaxID=763406 RepID=A0A1E3NTW7_9ASCO|nr:hypothetical protein PICMEDRAFT_70982 [Pichia membranifaciens NRRL Y-2026]ODQ49436.1 hypothetical protein PICMEDRAFT_70982 [Pichia membranifaciens NRRL Y-2026]